MFRHYARRLFLWRSSSHPADDRGGVASEVPAEVLTWQPQAGPQKAFVESPVFDVVYGGARGGGKTDAALGDFALHARDHDAAAKPSMS